jgi:exodeoxyribonuclease VII large subunit
MQLQLNNRHSQLSALTSRLKTHEPKRQLRAINERVAEINRRLDLAIFSRLETSQQNFAFLAMQLHTLSPLNTIARGYSILRKDDDSVVMHANQLKADENIHALMRGGTASLKVIAIEPDDQPKTH